MDACLWWLDRGPPAHGEATVDWTTANRIALELPTMSLRDFSTRPGGQSALICAPFALHRALIADFAPDHSVVESLQRGGVDRVFLTDWRSASPDMRYLAIISAISTSPSTRSALPSISSGCARAVGCRCSMRRVFLPRCGGW
jgi:hypothetical protein